MLTFEQIKNSGLKKVVMYHKKCADGFCAAFLLWLYFGDKAIYLPVNYGEPVPFTGLPAERSDIMIVDFSFPREVLVDIASKHNVVVFDHHKTAMAALEGLDFCKFDLDRCGAGMVADWMGMERSPLVSYVQDRDLWQWKLPNSREISAAIASYPYDFAAWKKSLGSWDSINNLIQEGTAILRYQKQLLELQATEAVMVTTNAIPYVQINATAIHSELGEFLLKKYPEAKFAAIYVTQPTGFKFSLRSRSADECDITKIAKRFPGGGGHPCAGGFTLDKDDISNLRLAFGYLGYNDSPVVDGEEKSGGQISP